MSYRFWRYHKTEKAQIFEVDEKSDMKAWDAEHPGWYDHPNKIPKKVTDVSMDKIDLEESIKKVDEETKQEEEDSMTISPEILGKVTQLLKGKKVENCTGLSLTSFCQLYGILKSNHAAKAEKRPLYDALVAKLQADDSVYYKQNRWYYKDK